MLDRRGIGRFATIAILHRNKGIKEVGLDDGLFNVTTDPAVAVKYANRYGGTSPRVAVIRIPEKTFQGLFRRGLINEHPVLGPNNFQIRPEGQQVINQSLGH